MGIIEPSLKVRVTLIILGIFIFISLIDFAIKKYAIYPSFIQLEQHEVKKNAERCKQAVDREIADLHMFCGDWSSWSDTYSYVQNSNRDYEESNLLDETFAAYGLQLIIILNDKNEVVWGKIFDPDSKNEIKLKGFSMEKFPKNHPALQFEEKDNLKDRVRTGVINFEYGPLLISSRPILKSNSEGPIRGTLIMGKFLSEKVMESIRLQANVPFKIILPYDTNDNFSVIKANIDKNNGSYIETLEKFLVAYEPYLDINSKTGFIIETQFPREITEKGFTALRFSFIVMIFTSLIILMIVYTLLRKSIIKPITTLTDFTLHIKENRNYSERVSIDGFDEIATLADHMNDMVSTIEEQTTDLTKTNLNLEKSLNEIKTLKGVVPICARCKKIRDDKGYWNILESYIQKHSDASFSHGVCPECSDDLYGDQDWYRKMAKKDTES